jgi:tRNA pseudouridine55 synthase
MNGLLVIDKPAGITSHDVVSRVRRILKTRRVGHTGTLDPFATGVMVILVGSATRLAQFVDKDEKEYEALVRFGFETDTGDVTGVRSAECGVRNEEVAELLTSTDWKEVLNEFRGDILQTPPMYSAKKVEGKKLYELARKGVEIERKAISVNVRELELLGLQLDDNMQTARVRVACSAGTYIRTLAEDIGRRLRTGAHLLELRRTRSGRFRMEESLTLEQLQALENPAEALLPASEAVAHLPQMVLTSDRIAKTRSGMSTRFSAVGITDGQSVSMVDESGELIAVGHYRESEKAVQPKVVLV